MSLFQGRLGVRQVEGIETILRCFEVRSSSQDLRPLAYILATAHHETGRSFQPIREWGSKTYLTRNYDMAGDRPRLAKANGNTVAGDGIRYAGRGFVQLTWRNNYRRVGEKLGIDLEDMPQLALELDVAASILVRGMQEGWFTGRRLDQYFNETTEDWINARRIVNGTDKAKPIAAYGQAFLAVLKSAGSEVSGADPAKITARIKVSSTARRPKRKMRTLPKSSPEASQRSANSLLIQDGYSGS